MQTPTFEMLTWRSLEHVSDQSMIEAMTEFSQAVNKLSGFLHQALYKNTTQEWVCIYYWRTEKEAHDSNAAVANEPSFHALMALIDEGSITMQIFQATQSSGQLEFS